MSHETQPVELLPNRPRTSELSREFEQVPLSCRHALDRSLAGSGEHAWIGSDGAVELDDEFMRGHDLHKTILAHLAVRAPREASSGHPGGSASGGTVAYCLESRFDPEQDFPILHGPGHYSVLQYDMQWAFGHEGDDPRLESPQAIIENFRRPDGLPGHYEAGIGNTPFGAGPLGKMMSYYLGVAFERKKQGHTRPVHVQMGDGDMQEGQTAEALRLAPALKADNLVVHVDFNNVQLQARTTDTMASDFAAEAHATGWHVVEVENGNNPKQVCGALDKVDSLVGKGKPILVVHYTTMGHGVKVMEDASNLIGEPGGKIHHGAPLNDAEADAAFEQLPDFEKAVAEYDADFRKQHKKRYEAATKVNTNQPLDFDLAATGYERAITAEKGAARKDFGAVHLLNLMKEDDRIVVLHADIGGSGGLGAIEKAFPDRIYNVGIAEANMYMMAAGIRAAGGIPVTYTFSAFGTNEARANQRLTDINNGHTRCGVLNFCTHTGTSVGEDGETHQDQNYLNIPHRHTRVWCSADSNQAAAMAEAGTGIVAEGSESVYAFFPRDGHEQLKKKDGSVFYGEEYVFDGKADVIRGNDDVSDDVTIITTGITTHAAVAAAEELEASGKSVRVLNIASVRPIDSAAILKAALETGDLIVAEDHNTDGGLATIVGEVITKFGLPTHVHALGLNEYLPSGKAAELYKLVGLTKDGMLNAIRDRDDRVDSRTESGFVAFALNVRAAMNADDNRFAEMAVPLIESLSGNNGYLETLRAQWQDAEPESMPQSAAIRKKLQYVYTM